MRTALASFPRSGNHWLRYMIEQATGQETGTVYHVDGVMERGHEGIVVKTHHLESEGFDQAVHLMRNPIDAMHSWRNWRRYKGNRDEWLSGVIREDFFLTQMWRWERHTATWLAFAKPVHRLRYEDLKDDPRRTLKGVLDFLGCPDDPQRLDAAVAAGRIERMQSDASLGKPAQRLRFFREGKVLSGHQSFSLDQLERLRDRLAYLLADPRVDLIDQVNASIAEKLKSEAS